MKSRSTLRWLVGGIFLLLIVCLAIALCVVWIAREGYLYPVPYVERTLEGQVEEEGFRMRELNGLWYQQGRVIRYHPQGTKSFEGRYERGRQVGTWKMWDPDGTLTDVTEYADPPDGLMQPGDLLIHRTEFENGVAKTVFELWFERGKRTTWLNPDGTPSKVEEYDDHNTVLRVTVYENGVAKVIVPDAGHKR